MREWLIIESSMKNGIFVSETPQAQRKGYIPRDVAEKLLGRDLGGLVWFTDKESAAMRRQPEWSDTVPPGADAEGERK